jgi:hypothetical protein
MVLHRPSSIAIGAVLATLWLAQAHADDKPKLANSPTAFFAGAKALAASAGDYVQLERSTERLHAIRAELARRLLGANATSKLALDDLVEERKLLCEPRVNHLVTVARASYLNGIVSQADEIGKKEKPDDLFGAIKLLFAHYGIDGHTPALDPAVLKALGDKTRTRCETDIKGFDIAHYGVAVAPPPPAAPMAALAPAAVPAAAVALLGPFGTLIDTFLGIIQPVVIEAAAIEDAFARDAAIRAFLGDPENQKNLKDIGEKLGKAASDFNFDKRRQLAGAFVEGVRVIQATQADLAKLEECKDLSIANLARATSGAPSPAFTRCWRKVWGQIDSVVAATLKAASDYDLLADGGDTDAPLHAYRKLIAKLDDIAKNNDLDLEELWQFVTNAVAFAGTVQTAFSQENRDKLAKAIDGLVKGL